MPERTWPKAAKELKSLKKKRGRKHALLTAEAHGHGFWSKKRKN